MRLPDLYLFVAQVVPQFILSLEVSLVKLSQQLVYLLLLPLPGAMLTEDFSQPPHEVAVFHHPLVKALEQRAQIDHVLRPDVQQLVVERPGRAVEIVVNVIKPDHMQLVQHRVGIRAAVEEAPQRFPSPAPPLKAAV